MHHWPWQGLTLRYFSPSEYDHPELMDPAFLKIIDEWRERCGFGIVVIDDARTKEEHEALYRAEIQAGKQPPNSAHLRGRALDCRPVAPSRERLLIMVGEAIQMWREGRWPHLGLEIATHHIHVDSDPELAALGVRPHIWAGVSK